MEAYLLSLGEVVDQRAANRREPNVPVSVEELTDIGVFYMHLDPEKMLVPGDAGADGLPGPTAVDAIATTMQYVGRDEVRCSPEHLPDYDAKLRDFFAEHIHEDEEIRLVKEGVAYFDVRDRQDQWVRIRLVAGDLIVLPAGIYHRFSMDESNFTHAIRLFKDAPRWARINRPCDDHPCRIAYLERFAASRPRQTLVGPADGVLNHYVHFPTALDEVVRGVIRATMVADPSALLVLYFSGTHNPTSHKSWCPDCVASDPVVAESVKELRASGRPVVFLDCPVERASYKSNPEYLYRKHPFMSIRCIPTLIVCSAVTGDDDEGAGLREIWRKDDVIPPFAASVLKTLPATSSSVAAA